MEPSQDDLLNADFSETLSWLSEAETTLQAAPSKSESLTQLKNWFQLHEEFMAKLSSGQEGVGKLLQEARRIQSQRSNVQLLNQKWETVRSLATARQAILQKQLMDVQQKELDELDEWLQQIEHSIAQCEGGVSPENLSKLRKEHTGLQSSLEEQEERVGRLQNMIFVEEEEDDIGLDSLEAQLESLGNRWSSVCSWVDQRSTLLTNVAQRWNELGELVEKLQTWIATVDGSVPETEMEERVRQLEEIQTVGQDLSTMVSDSSPIENLIEDIEVEWNSLLETMACSEPGDVSSEESAEVQQLRNQYEEHRVKLMEWLEKTEATLSLLEGEELNTDEKQVLMEDVNLELEEIRSLEKSWSATCKSVQRATKCQSTLSQITLSTKQIQERWDDLVTQIEQLNLKIKQDSDLMEVAREQSAVRKILDDYAQWVEFTSERTSESDGFDLFKHAEQAKVKLKSMKARRLQLEKLLRLVRPLPESSEVRQQSEALERDWDQTSEKLRHRHDQLQSKLNTSPSKTYIDLSDSLRSWMTLQESKLESFPALLMSPEMMQERTTSVLTMQEELKERLASLEWLQKSCQHLSTSSIYVELQDLRERWEELSANCQTRHQQLLTLSSQHVQLQRQQDGLRNWLAEVKSFLKSEKVNAGDVETLQQQLEESDGMSDDIRTLQERMDAVDKLAGQLIQSSDTEIRERIECDIRELNVEWRLIRQQTDDHKCDIEICLTETTDAQETLGSIRDLVMRLPSFGTVNTPDELDSQLEELSALIRSMRNTLNECDQLNAKIGSWNCVEGELQKDAKTVRQEWASRLQQYEREEAQMKDHRMDTEKLQKITKDLRDFLKSVEIDSHNVDEVADAEEIAETIDDWEERGRMLRVRLESFQMLESDLLERDVTPLFVRRLAADVRERSAGVDELTKALTKELHERLVEAQRRDADIHDTTVWVAETSNFLQSRIDAKIVAPELPDVLARITDELAERRLFITRLVEDEEALRARGCLRNAERIRQQHVLLAKHCTDVATKLDRLDRDPNFEPKQASVRGGLARIGSRLNVLDSGCDDVELLQQSNELADELYNELTRLKPDLEYVLRVGRQMGLREQLDDGGQADLDGLKVNFNNLAERVGRSRNDAAQRYATVSAFQKAQHQASVFLERAETTLSDLELQDGLEGQPESSRRLDEIEAQAEKLDTSLQDVSTQLSCLEEPVKGADQAVTRLTERLRNVRKRVTVVSTKRQRAHDEIDELSERVGQLQLELDSWIDSIETQLSPVGRGGDDVLTSLRAEATQKSSVLENLRDLALEVMSRDRSTQRPMQATLAELNHRWHGAINKLRNDDELSASVTAIYSSAEFEKDHEVREQIRSNSSGPLSALAAEFVSRNDAEVVEFLESAGVGRVSVEQVRWRALIESYFLLVEWIREANLQLSSREHVEELTNLIPERQEQLHALRDEAHALADQIDLHSAVLHEERFTKLQVEWTHMCCRVAQNNAKRRDDNAATHSRNSEEEGGRSCRKRIRRKVTVLSPVRSDGFEMASSEKQRRRYGAASADRDILLDSEREVYGERDLADHSPNDDENFDDTETSTITEDEETVANNALREPRDEANEVRIEESTEVTEATIIFPANKTHLPDVDEYGHMNVSNSEEEAREEKKKKVETEKEKEGEEGEKVEKEEEVVVKKREDEVQGEEDEVQQEEGEVQKGEKEERNEEKDVQKGEQKRHKNHVLRPTTDFQPEGKFAAEKIEEKDNSDNEEGEEEVVFKGNKDEMGKLWGEHENVVLEEEENGQSKEDVNKQAKRKERIDEEKGKGFGNEAKTEAEVNDRLDDLEARLMKSESLSSIESECTRLECSLRDCRVQNAEDRELLERRQECIRKCVMERRIKMLELWTQMSSCERKLGELDAPPDATDVYAQLDWAQRVVELADWLKEVEVDLTELQLEDDSKAALKMAQMKKTLEARQLAARAKLESVDVQYRQQQLGLSVLAPWERSLTVNNVPYYIDHNTERTHWDHPDMTTLLDTLGEYNYVRFAAYKAALKLRLIQKRLYLDLFPLPEAMDLVDEVGGRTGSLDASVLCQLCSELYLRLDGVYPGMLNVPLLADLLLNLLLNLHDGNRRGTMSSGAVKCSLGLLSFASLTRKYALLCSLGCAGSDRVSADSLATLLRQCLQMPRMLGEVASFGGSGAEASVQSCMSDEETVGKRAMLEWLRRGPQALVWLPAMHRIAAAESAKHQAKCNVCKALPIIGLRYRCLKCFNFDLCQRCFFSGSAVRGHKVSHPIREYCKTTTSGEDVRDLRKVIRNKITSKSRGRPLGYLPVSRVTDGGTSSRIQRSQSTGTLHARIGNFAHQLANVETEPGASLLDLELSSEHDAIRFLCSTLGSLGPPSSCSSSALHEHSLALRKTSTS